jgi:hypothetical protein
VDDIFEEDDFDNNKSVVKKEKNLFSLDFKSTPINLKHYWTFYFIHFIYFNILGPFIGIFFIFTQKSRNLFHNMQIIRWTTVCGLNTIPWLCNFLIILYFYQTNFQEQAVYSVVIYNMVSISLLKCAIIAGKYCSLGYEKLNQLYIRRLPLAELHGEHMLESWAEQTPLQVLKHITSAMARFEIDDANLVVSFMRNPRDETIKALKLAELEEARLSKLLKDKLDEPEEIFKDKVKNFKYDEKKNNFTLYSKDRNSISI